MMDDHTDQLADALHIELGRCITQWAKVEHHLCILFVVLMRSEDDNRSFWTFWAVSSFKGKLDMTAAAAHRAFANNPELMSEWNACKNKLGKISLKRNELAHASISCGKRGIGEERETFAELIPYGGKNTLPVMAGDVHALTIKDLKQRLIGFKIAADRVFCMLARANQYLNQ
ncbi:hypothetical protein [Marinicauda salina]|uniref:hypothetical protein n=1 Tax=Marinicauda salina TaxID=2135793 RepID=UPI0011B20620|nr:hypothetical protein [Marinicauda salina]